MTVVLFSLLSAVFVFAIAASV
ncbi:MAG: hypothetical protein RLZ18_302, partial [Actinomycetota bacterium]